METAVEQRSAEYARRSRQARRMCLPAWWRNYAPNRGPRFWRAVDLERREAGIKRWDMANMAHIITNLDRRLK